MASSRLHIGIIVIFAVLLHVPVLTGIFNPIPRNFTWTPPWSGELLSEKGGYYDYQQEYLPWAKFLNESLKSGELPLWNPYQFCGTPYIANHLLSPLYPPVLLGTLVPFQFTAFIISLISFILGPIFLYGYLRRIGLDGIPSLLGSLLFCSTGIFTPLFPPWGASIIWIPAILYILEGWMQARGSWRDVPLLGIVLGLWFIGGYPVFVAHGLYFILIYAILLPRLALKLPVLLKFIIAVILGILISSGQNLPTLFFALDSARFTPDANEMLQALFNPGNILNHLLPSQTGAFKTSYLYIGLIAILPLPFAFIRPSGRTIYHITWFILSLVIGLIPALFITLYNSLPLWNITPHPPITPLFITIPVLAAIGINALFSDDVAIYRGRSIAMIVTVVIFALTTILAFITGINKTITLYLLCAAIATFIFVRFAKRLTSESDRFQSSIALILVVLLSTTGIFWSNIRHNRPVDELLDDSIFRGHLESIQEDGGRFFRISETDFLPPDTGIFWNLEDVGGYDSLILRNFYDAALLNGLTFYRARESESLTPGQPYNQSLYEEFGITTMFVSPGKSGPISHGWKRIPTEDTSFQIYRNDRIWRAGFIPEGKYMADAVPLKYIRNGPNSIEVEIGGNYPEGSVIIKDTYAEGWTALLDSEKVPVELYHGWMRKIDIPPGAEKIVMNYDPVEFKIGIGLSLIGLFISLSWILGGYRRKAVHG